jgi:hypothetical protein
MTETPKFWNLYPFPVTNQKVTARLYKKNGHNKAKEKQLTQAMEHELNKQLK